MSLLLILENYRANIITDISLFPFWSSRELEAVVMAHASPCWY